MIRALQRRIGTPGLGLLALVLTVAVTLVFYMGLWTSITREEGTEYKVRFAGAPQLYPGDPVKADGQTVGRVNKVVSLPDDRGAEVTVEVLDKAGTLYKDASAELRWRLLLGGAFNVTIERGSPSAGELAEGATIGLDRTRVQVELDDLSHTFQGGSQRGLRTMPGELATALEDETALAGTMDALADGSPSIRRGLHALRGRELDRDLRRVVTGAASVVATLDQPNRELETLIGGAAATTETVAARNAELKQALSVAPATMNELDITLARLQPTLTSANDLVQRLMGPAGDVGPTLAALRPTLTDTSRLLRGARPLAGALRPAVRSLAATAEDGIPLINDLRPSLARLEDTILPYMHRKDPETGKSTTVMIGGTAAGFGGSAGQQDENGHFIRFPASGGSRNVYLPCSFSAVDNQDPTAPVVCDSLETALDTYLNYIPGSPGQGGR